MPIAINPAATEEYRLPAEEGRDDAARFIIGTIAAWEMMELMARITRVPKPTQDGDGMADYYAAFAPIMRDVLRAGLRGWRGFRLADGSDAPFRTGAEGRPGDATLAYLDAPTANALAWAIIRFNQVGPAERGN